MHVTLIHNPDAGVGSPQRDELITFLEGHGHTVAYHSTLAGDFEHALADPSDLVVACGGDGTVASVARRLVGRGIPLALIPFGTANNIASALGVQGDWKEILGDLDAAQRRKLDVGVANAPWGSARFVESAGLGLFAAFLYTVDEVEAEDEESAPAEGSASEELSEGAKQLKRVLKRTRARRWSVEADGVDLSGEYILVAALNTPCVGPQVVLAPGADPGDGLLDLVLVGEDDRESLGRYLAALKDGDAAPKPLPTRRVSTVTLGWVPEAGHLDDERWPVAGPEADVGPARPMVQLTLVHPPLEVLVPAASDSRAANRSV